MAYQMTPEDIKRKQQLNREENIPETIMNEATQTINPITGKPYLERSDFPLYFSKDEGDGNLGFDTPLRNPYLLISYDPANSLYTSGLMDSQLALLEMNVRDGKASDWDYQDARGSIVDIVRRMDKAGIPVDAITTPEGLAAALDHNTSYDESVETFHKRNNIVDLCRNKPRPNVYLLPNRQTGTG